MIELPSHILDTPKANTNKKIETIKKYRKELVIYHCNTLPIEYQNTSKYYTFSKSQWIYNTGNGSAKKENTCIKHKPLF